MSPDPHGQNYRVLSVYLDTPGLSLWGDHAILHKGDRYKLRIRTYAGKTDTYFFEVKRKRDGIIEKYRAPVNETEFKYLHDVINAGRASEVAPNYGGAMRLFLDLAGTMAAKPKLGIAYDREAYKYLGSSRLTIDTNIFCRKGDMALRLLDPEVSVLELKFDHHMPKLMTAIVEGFGLKRIPYSKYTIGLSRLGAWAEWGGYPGMAFKTFAGILIYCEDDGTILLVRRSQEMKNPRKWDLPGGHGDESDGDPFQTALREAMEEIQVLPHDNDFLGEHVVLEDPKDDTIRRRVVFLYSVSGEEKKRLSSQIRLNFESEGFCWFKLDEMPEKLHFDLSWVPEELAARLGGGRGSGSYMYMSMSDQTPEDNFWNFGASDQIVSPSETT